MTRRTAFALAVASCAAFAFGCSDPERPTGDVTGKVTLGDKTLTAGSVRFQSAGGTGPILSADIGYEGTYRITMLPPGDYKVVVETAFLLKMKPPPGGGDLSAAPPEKGKGKTATAAPKEKYVLVNKKYERFDQSTLKATVVPGPQVVNFDCP